MEFQINKDIKFRRNEKFISKLNEIEIKKYHKQVEPTKYQKNVTDSVNIWANYVVEEGIPLSRKENCLIDFDDHRVGKVSFDIVSEGSPPDAPVKLHIWFGETLEEVLRRPESYHGDLSSSWIQEELLTLDVLPIKVELSRRFAFRYIRIEVIDASPKFSIKLKINCTTESSADINKLVPFETEDELLKKIDIVSQKTLVQCMQDVFEDGPKRDRRLWLGDLRIQALANYVTFAENDLVKKCLYLFAAEVSETGQTAANVFIAPKLIPDDTFLADYSLFFIDTLLSYYLETKDTQTLNDLYSTATAQLSALSDVISDEGEVCPPEGWWAFIDWNDVLSKKLAIQGIFIYSYKKMSQLSALLKRNEEKAQIDEEVIKMETWLMENGYDSNKELFVDPETKQISLSTHSWIVLAEVGNTPFRQKLLRNLIGYRGEVIECNTPYSYHHYVEALLQEGFHDEGTRLIKEYWGGMIQEGADTFWEVYNPKDKNFSPYGDSIVNSYCHAWSCTPCYLLRKY